MRIVNLSGLLVILFAISANATDRLPLQTEMLLQKLTDWEVDQIKKFDERVQAKRLVAAVSLKTHLKRATQAGDLKTANLIQAKIDELSSVTSATVEGNN